MERYRLFEREARTRAFSNIGLRNNKSDPTTQEKDDVNTWLSSSIDQLQIQINQFEIEIETILGSRKKKLDKERQSRLDELKNFVEKHRFHVSKLETLLRMLHKVSFDPFTVSTKIFCL